MARENRKAGEVQVGDKVFFPNSRRSTEVTNIVEQSDGTLKLFSDTTRWMMKPEFEVAVEVEDQPKEGIRDL